jgi:protein RecA
MSKPDLRVVEGRMGDRRGAGSRDTGGGLATMDKQKALEAALAQIDKNFGKGSIMRLGANATSIDVEAVGLDIALGLGGFPKGRIIEIYGPESSGKTTLALHAIAEAQKAGGVAAFIDAEHALDPVYARNLGVDTDGLWVSQPDNGEQALEIAEALVRSKAVDIIVVDSVAALTPQAEIEGDMGDSHVGLQARLMSQALRKLTGIISKSSTVLVFINQIRMKIGVMFGNPRQPPAATPSSSMRQSASRFAGSKRSARTPMRRSATAFGSKSSRTRSRRRSVRSNLRSSSARAFPRLGNWSTSV